LCSHGDKIDVLKVRKNIYRLRKKYLKLRFIDSFKFLSTSLEKLCNGLEIGRFKETRKYFLEIEKFELGRQKGVFLYSFIDSIEKMNYPTLPTKKQFFDTLSEEHVSNECYERAKKVWRLFDCKNLGKYSDLYLKSDVTLLSDAFEQFRDTYCLKVYKLDPAQYYTLPGLSFDCMLRMTKVELELLTDIDMVHFLKKGIRGSISQCTERMHVANNRYLPNFDPTKPSSFITYLDATNLYGHSMSQALPFGGFKWLSQREINDLNILDVDDNSANGYV